MQWGRWGNNPICDCIAWGRYDHQRDWKIKEIDQIIIINKSTGKSSKALGSTKITKKEIRIESRAVSSQSDWRGKNQAAIEIRKKKIPINHAKNGIKTVQSSDKFNQVILFWIQRILWKVDTRPKRISE